QLDYLATELRRVSRTRPWHDELLLAGPSVPKRKVVHQTGATSLTDNAWPYRKSFAWKQALADLDAVGKLTRAYRPQTNGKVERF
ncbi:hypothetical protein RNC47_37515, partial [Streptomyces sp. DSM 44918]|nr:hypothetical protein [Streptomyces sp. DSM 44918]